MLAQCNDDGIVNQKSALNVIGERFRVAIEDRVGPWEVSEVSMTSFSLHLSTVFFSSPKYS